MILMVPTLTSNGLYGCCISVECSEVTVSSSGSGVQAGALPERVPSKLSKKFQFFICQQKLRKKFKSILANCL